MTRSSSRKSEPSKQRTDIECLVKNAQTIGIRLRTLLKLSKAYRWACCEWFTANIDRTLLAGENDFRHCLKEMFPNLKTRMLTRAKWCKIRRHMGKPRRFSQAFLAEERKQLHIKRKKIRQLQQQKVVDINQYKDLPGQIPLSLVVGTRVSALLHHPHDGLFIGTIDAVDTNINGYRITFDKESIGTLTVPDYEVLSLNTPEFLPLLSFQSRIKSRMPVLTSPRFLENLGAQLAEAVGQRQESSKKFSTNHEGEYASCGEYPIKLLALMVRVSKLLSDKKKRIAELKSMNDEVERLTSLNEKIPVELKNTYAGVVIDLEKLNSDLDDHLKAVQFFSAELPTDSSLIPDPESIKNRCQIEAKQTVDQALTDFNLERSDSIMTINQMMSIIYHLKTLSESDDNALQLRALNETISEYKSKLSQERKSDFENNVEIHLNFIKNSSNNLNIQKVPARRAYH